jgi:hypothetical protein
MTGAGWAPSVLERIEKEGGTINQSQDVLEVLQILYCVKTHIFFIRSLLYLPLV